jgi:hypothetical protein
MNCYGKDFHKNSIECQLCKRINDGTYEKCRDAKELRNTLEEIKYSCRHFNIAYDDYWPIHACDKNGNGHGRNADDCEPTLECKQYCNPMKFGGKKCVHENMERR